MNFATIVDFFSGESETHYYLTKKEMLAHYDILKKECQEFIEDGNIVAIHFAVLYTKEEIEQLF